MTLFPVQVERKYRQDFGFSGSINIIR